MASLRQQLAGSCTTISTFNIFETNTPLDDDEYEHKTQIISTRLFIILLILSLTILLLYTSQVQVTHTITVDSPDLSRYLSLYQDYGEKVTCPCTTIAFAQEEFISLTPIFHQVCLSDFVTTGWVNFINAAAATYVSPDFRYSGGVLFQILASFCLVANESITDSLPSFYSAKFVSIDVINSELLEKESQSLIDLYITTTANAFAQSFDLIRDITYSNALVPGLFTSIGYELGSYSTYYDAYETVPHFQSYNQPHQCNCELTPSCIAQVAIHNMTNSQISNQTLFAIPGLYIGCYLIEAMRQSNLQCLYDQTCLNQLAFYLQSPQVFNATALNNTVPSRFNVSTAVSEILAVLMVDSWISNISYSSYYDQCQPSYCTYSLIGKNSILFILTTLIGLFGGLYKALRVLIPFPVRLIRNRRRKIQPSTTQESANSSNQNTSCGHVLEIKIKKLFQSIQSLNLFEESPPSTDQHQVKSERISTFIYLISLITCLLCLISYITDENVTQTITINTPSLNDYKILYEKQNTKLSCPCSTITTEYQDFLYIEPELHQFCSSDFVQNDWLNYIYPNEDLLYVFDLRRSASIIFHAMASYCSVSNETISNGLIVFQSTQMISAELLSEDLFHGNTKLFVAAFIQSMVRALYQNLEFIRMSSYGNQILNGMNTNFQILFFGAQNGTSYAVGSYTVDFYLNCLCDFSSQCSVNTGIYIFNGTYYNLEFEVPGIMIGCYTNEALRQSTLECFYDESCVGTIKQYLNFSTDFNTTALDPMLTSHYNATTVFDDLINNLMVEQWIWNDSYVDYYTKCQPSSCSYKVVIKTPFIVVFTTLIGLFGGLVKILRIIVPLIVQLLRRQKRVPQIERLPLRDRLTNIYQKCLHSIHTFNLFRKKKASDNTEHETNNQIVSTRFFIILLIASLVILVIYTSQTQTTHIITVNAPSIDIYSSLYQQYGEKLTCPCATIATAQKEFISVKPTYNQICTSDFVNPSWPQAIYDVYSATDTTVYNRDFRFRGFYYFQMLASLCTLANSSLTDALADFDETFLISANILPERVFNSQVNATIDLFITSITNSFIRSFRVIRDTTQGNSLVSNMLSSLTFRLVVNETNTPNDASTWQITLRYKTYTNGNTTCSCHDTPTCMEPAYVWTLTQPFTKMFPVPGIVVGCYTFEAMLQSTFICFYNQTCVDWLSRSLNLTQSLNFTALDPSQPSRFQLNSNIENILEYMMIEQWARNISYANYYDQCHPIYCKYSYIQKNDVLYIITTITALIGGLTSVLQMIVPPFVKLIRRFFCTVS